MKIYIFFALIVMCATHDIHAPEETNFNNAPAKNNKISPSTKSPSIAQKATWSIPDLGIQKSAKNLYNQAFTSKNNEAFGLDENNVALISPDGINNYPIQFDTYSQRYYYNDSNNHAILIKDQSSARKTTSQNKTSSNVEYEPTQLLTLQQQQQQQNLSLPLRMASKAGTNLGITSKGMLIDAHEARNTTMSNDKATIATEKIKIKCDKYGYPTTDAVQALMKKQYFGDKKVVVKLQNTGANSDQIYNISVEGKPTFFLKITKSDTSERLNNLQENSIGRVGIESRYADTKLLIAKKNLPIIAWVEKFYTYTDPKSSQIQMELIHAAKGEPVDNFMNAKQNIANQQKCMKSTGTALGSFQQIFIDYKDPKDPHTWTTVSHGDFHSLNVFFDANKSQVYFIDNETMQTQSPVDRDIITFCFGSIELINNRNDNSLQYARQVNDFLDGYINSFPPDKQIDLARYIQKEFMMELYKPNDSDNRIKSMVNFNLKKIVTKNNKQNQQNFKVTSLHLAVADGSIEKIKALLADPATDINSKDIDGASPLSWAIQCGNPDIIKLLCEDGADVTTPINNNNDTLLHRAVMLNDSNVVQALLQGSNINVSAQNNSFHLKTPLDIATFYSGRVKYKPIQKNGETIAYELDNSIDQINKLKIINILMDALKKKNIEFTFSSYKDEKAIQENWIKAAQEFSTSQA